MDVMARGERRRMMEEGELVFSREKYNGIFPSSFLPSWEAGVLYRVLLSLKKSDGIFPFLPSVLRPGLTNVLVPMVVVGLIEPIHSASRGVAVIGMFMYACMSVGWCVGAVKGFFGFGYGDVSLG